MSWWTHTRGIMVVNCCYGSQFNLNQIMKKIIEHAPSVTGSEGDLNIACVQDTGYDTVVYKKVFDKKEQKEKLVKYTSQSRFSLIFNGDFRNRMLDDTKKELEYLLLYVGCRLLIDTCYIEVYDDFSKHLYTKDSIVSTNGLSLKELGLCESGCAVDAVKELNLMCEQFDTEEVL